MSHSTHTELGIAAVLGVSTVCAALANNSVARHAPKLPPAIDAKQGVYDWDGGCVAYSAAGQGSPILLLHSHNAAASTYEVREIFRELSSDYRVFAPDLPGYGRSERRARCYFAGTYTRFILDFIHDVIGGPSAVIAASLSACHTLTAAVEDPDAISSLILSSPMGLTEATIAPSAVMRRLSLLGLLPVWGHAAFNTLVSRRSIRWHYENLIFHRRECVTGEMVDYAWATAHQPNAIHAPASFLHGDLWADSRTAIRRVSQPIMCIWGENDRFNPFQSAIHALPSPVKQGVRVFRDCGGAPHAEQAPEFSAATRSFLSAAGSRLYATEL